MAKISLFTHVSFTLSLTVFMLINLYTFVALKRKTSVLGRRGNTADCHVQKSREIWNHESDKVVGTDLLVDAMIRNLSNTQRLSARTIFPDYFWNMTLDQQTRKLGFDARSMAKKLPAYANVKTSESSPAWKLVHSNIRRFSLYSPDDQNVDQLLHDLSTLPIIATAENKGGTQFKIDVQLSDGGWALLKPMKYGRDVEADNVFVYIERHIAEIAAFQLDRILGFYRVPPAVGRLVNITSELKHIFPKSVNDTLFISSEGNVCFYGSCRDYCDRDHAFCGHPEIIEVAMMSYLPSTKIARRTGWRQPWENFFTHKWRAYWEENNNLCTRIRKDPHYNNGKLLLDIIDAHTFDFLAGNKDRHSFSFFVDFSNYSFPILFDNGKGHGRTMFDVMSILAPLEQCCLIRESTFLKYVKLYQGPEKLSSLMEKALENDPVAPVLSKEHLEALDRRVMKILRVVADCVQKFGFEEVIYHDRF